ncbi:MAG: response regulator transcription factor [Xenococcaceae cyanobacterium]
MMKVLVIEDEAQSRNIFIDSLEAEGFEAIGAENGLVGVQKAQTELPDLVLCDVNMPELDGFGVLSELRQHPTTAIVPFIFLTGNAAREDIRQGMELGADDYLTKPSTIEELLAAIETRLQKQKLFQQWYNFKAIKILEEENTKKESSSIFPSNPELKEIFEFIEAHYHESISLRDVAVAVGYSSGYLTRSVKKQTGKPINSWIVERRMAEAESMLKNSNCSIEKIAETIGYQNINHFFRQFRQYHNTTPQGWRNAQLSKTNPN